jgi:hypothetical protein
MVKKKREKRKKESVVYNPSSGDGERRAESGEWRAESGAK